MHFSIHLHYLCDQLDFVCLESRIIEAGMGFYSVTQIIEKFHNRQLSAKIYLQKLLNATIHKAWLHP